MTDLGLMSQSQVASIVYQNMTTSEKLALADENNAALMKRFAEVSNGRTLVEWCAEYAKVDGSIIDTNGKMIALYEAKTRIIDSATLLANAAKGDEWIMNLDKLLVGMGVAAQFKCAFYGIIYCTVDKALITVRIFEDGVLHAPFHAKRSVTSAGTMGGEATRNNAYVSLANAKVYPAESDDDEI